MVLRTLLLDRLLLLDLLLVAASVQVLVEWGELATVVFGDLSQLESHFGFLPQSKPDSLILQELVVADEVFAKASRAQYKVMIGLRLDNSAD